MSIGKQMRLRREELGLSRAELAKELGVSPSAISNYENGVSSPKEDILLKLFNALRIDPNYLYRDFFRAEAPDFSHEEHELIAQYRALPPRGPRSGAHAHRLAPRPVRRSNAGTAVRAAPPAALSLARRRG